MKLDTATPKPCFECYDEHEYGSWMSKYLGFDVLRKVENDYFENIVRDLAQQFERTRFLGELRKRLLARDDGCNVQTKDRLLAVRTDLLPIFTKSYGSTLLKTWRHNAVRRENDTPWPEPPHGGRLTPAERHGAETG